MRNVPAGQPQPISDRAPISDLQMLACWHCGAKNFVPKKFPPLAVIPCGKCQEGILVPLRLRQFELRRMIGTGGMGVVYEATDVVLQRSVAIKLIHEALARDPEALNAFQREARICGALRHSNIISIYAFEEFADKSYLVMEMASGGSLQTRVEKEERVAELDVLDIGVKIASALASALKKGLLHSDIKPGNILFDADQEPKLVDFGLARRVEESSKENNIWGTPNYMAPEKAASAKESFLSDLYSLAGTLYFALTGKPPFQAETVEEVLDLHRGSPLVPPNQIVPEISHETCDAIVRAMAKNPADRHPSYDAFILDLTSSRSRLLVEKFRQTAGSGNGGKKWWQRFVPGRP